MCAPSLVFILLQGCWNVHSEIQGRVRAGVSATVHYLLVNGIRFLTHSLIITSIITIIINVQIIIIIIITTIPIISIITIVSVIIIIRRCQPNIVCKANVSLHATEKELNQGLIPDEMKITCAR